MSWLSRLLSTVLPLQITLENPNILHSADSARTQNGQHGAVASEAQECSQIGIDIMKLGGNSADAMVATTLCVGVIGMYHSGIAGGGFALVRSQDGVYEAVDFRETAPAAAHQDMYNGSIAGSVFGGLSAAVPADIRGLQYIHEKYGNLPWASVVTPAADVARHGFRVSEDLVRYMDIAKRITKRNFLVEDPSWALDFAPDGRLVQLGDIMYRKRYADTLDTIAREGPDAFYYGPIANSTIRAIQEADGIMMLEDLANYTVSVRPVVQIEYKGYRLSSVSAPASGAVALQMLKTMEGYNTTLEGESEELSTHQMVESMRFAYAARSNLGDPGYVAGLQSYEHDMLKSENAARIRSRITDTSHNVAYYNPSGLEVLETPGTSHIVTADASGMALTLTTTVNLLFGSGIMVPETGIIINDEMNDFSLPGARNEFGYYPAPANYIRPGKRPLSSCTPIIVEHASNNSLYYVVGAAGGSRIPTASVQAIWHVLDHGMTAADALAAPRFHDQLVPSVAAFEYGCNNKTVLGLREREHNVTWMAPGLSAVQAVRLKYDGAFEAASEPRQKNSAGLTV